MAREFLIRHEQNDCDDLARAIASREDELAAYDINVHGYMAQLASPEMQALPTEWPDELKHYRGKTAEQIFAIGCDNFDNAMLAVKLNHRDRVSMLLLTESAERHKSECSYNCLVARMADCCDEMKAAVDKLKSDRIVAVEAAKSVAAESVAAASVIADTQAKVTP